MLGNFEDFGHNRDIGNFEDFEYIRDF